jgi:phage pi2 protein 07
MIDDYDIFYHNLPYEYVHNYTCSLAEQSVNYKIMKILISVSDPIIAQNILSFNSGAKFMIIGSDENNYWTNNELREVTNLMIEDNKSWSVKVDAFSKNDIERINYLAEKSKNPLFVKLLISIHNTNYLYYHKSIGEHKNTIYNNIYDHLATQYYDHWIHGIKFINKYREIK